MKRKLLRQTLNEWRSNLWLIIELMIVSVAVWYMAEQLYLAYLVRNLPNGYETENVYITETHWTPTYNDVLQQYDSIGKIEARIANKEIILKAIEDMPGVEAVAAGNNNMPYNFNFSGQGMKLRDNDTLRFYGNTREATPEMAEVMHWKPLAGATSREELKAIVERGEMIISRSVGRVLIEDTEGLPDGLEGAKQLVGKVLYSPWNDKSYTVGAVVEDMRRGVYETANYGTLIMPLQRRSIGVTNTSEIIIRVDPSRRADFERAFNEALTADRLSTPLYYLTELSYMDDIARAHHASVNTENRNYTIIILFLLVSIFLGLMGTFWFRTQKRTSEIAIRMSAGARRGDIFRRLLGEGAILVVLATIPAAVIDWVVAWYLLGYPDQIGLIFNAWSYLAVGIVVTFILILLMTLAGIWLPARRAMAIDPATALHNE